MTLSGERGLSLIETLVAVTIFAVAAAAVSALSGTAYATADRNRDRATALALAASEVEDLRAARYDDLVGRFGVEVRDGRSFSVVRTVALEQPGANMATVTVSVTWSGRGGRRQTYATQTIVTAVQR